jgi:uncharacterized membrane protein
MAGLRPGHPCLVCEEKKKDVDARDKRGHDDSRLLQASKEASMTVLALALHILGAVVWVGGMFAAYMCLRPAAGPLELPARLKLWRIFFAKFYPWVWVAVIFLLVSGYWMVFNTFGGFAKLPMHVNLMQGIGWVMILLYVWLFHGPWLKLKRAVDASDWPTAAANLNRIRQIIMINLPLGLIVVIIGASGRYWG